jgi:hypothetical protein
VRLIHTYDIEGDEEADDWQAAHLALELAAVRLLHLPVQTA